MRNPGSAATGGGTLTVTADDPVVAFANSGSVALPAIQPYASATVTLDFTLSGASSTLSPTLHLALDAQGLAVPRTLSQDFKRRMNYDLALNSSATETFGVKSAGWVSSGDANLSGAPQPWVQKLDEAGEGTFAIPNNALRADQYLVSPPIQVGSDQSFGFTLKHRHSFETDASGNYDGAIIELSDDGGATWTDIGDKLTAGGYNGSLDSPASHQPLLDAAHPATRPAFVKQSDGYPGTTTTTADLAMAYAGKTVRLRFRVGTDDATGAPGWELDELALSGAASTPFPQHAADAGGCNRGPVVSITPPEQTVHPGDTVTLTGMASDPDGDQLTYMWTQQAGPMVPIADPSSLTQTFVAPPSEQPIEALFALAVSDGKLQTEVVAKVTISSGAVTPPADQGCDCRTAPTPLGGASGLWYLLLTAVAAWHCRRRTAS